MLWQVCWPVACCPCSCPGSWGSRGHPGWAASSSPPSAARQTSCTMHIKPDYLTWSELVGKKALWNVTFCRSSVGFSLLCFLISRPHKSDNALLYPESRGFSLLCSLFSRPHTTLLFPESRGLSLPCSLSIYLSNILDGKEAASQGLGLSTWPNEKDG